MTTELHTPLAGRRILIIEDDLFISRLYRKWLTHAGAHVRTANDGALGIQELTREGADIVLLDLGMPGLDGFDTLAIMRSQEHTKDTPVIVLTNTTIRDNWDGFEEIRAHGVTDILAKYEVSLKEIVATVAKYFKEPDTHTS